MASSTTARVLFHGYQKAASAGVDTPVGVNLPLDTKVSDIPLLLTTNHGFCSSYGVKLRGQAEVIPTSTYVIPPDAMTVVAGSSCSGPGKTRLTINENESLVSFFNKVYHGEEVACSIDTDRVSTNCISLDAGSGKLDISFKHTIRVPDDGKTHNLPPGLGEFPIFNVAKFSKTLPLDTVEKGGVFIAMYQREAMWIDFYTRNLFAIKVYLGGVNGISGEPMVPNMATYLKQKNNVLRKQDYITVPAQPWLDGIASSPGLVKQFVAMPYGSGYSVEHQITGMETVGGLQFEIIPAYDRNVFFSRQRLVDSMMASRAMDIFATPKDLGLQPGQMAYMVPKKHMNKRPVTLRDLMLEKSYNPAHGLTIDLHQLFVGKLKVSFFENGKSISFHSNSSVPFKNIINEVAKQTGLATENRCLWIGNQQINSWEDVRRLSPQVSGLLTQTTVELRWAREPSATSNLPWIYIQGPKGKPFVIGCKLSDTVNSVKEKIEDITGTPEYMQCLEFNGKELWGEKPLSEYDVQFESTLNMEEQLPRGMGAWIPDRMMSIGAGGTIKQSIAEDKNDPRVWNLKKAKLINVQIVNSVQFEEMTNMATPTTPVSLKTYASSGLPFFDIYNEMPSDISGAFNAVRTVSQRDSVLGARAGMVYDPTRPQICGTCSIRMCDCIIRPCNHGFCRLCVEKTAKSGKGPCPTCHKPISRIVGISAPMNAPGHEAASYSLPIVLLNITDRREIFRSIVARSE